ncbi:GAF domain-containing sensor histidine kinase [Calothrix rhizosoleniae]|uniref:GAF domain-containing sensor histidine kinase n=1 Tax=Calothrix rhizosoleniae TaxID=888997 RepID=UPI000B49E71E|nr:GAF domain-containing sensor histidine kinase [Calothrix rhizosoleniae]
MLSSPDLSFSRTLSAVVFNQLGKLLQQMAQAVENPKPLVITEELLVRIPIPENWRLQRFTVIVSQGFNALLLGSLEHQEGIKQTEDFFTSLLSEDNLTSIGSPDTLNVSLTFDGYAIASFLKILKGLFSADSQTHHLLSQYLPVIGANDPNLQSQFTLLLLKYFLPENSLEPTGSDVSAYPYISICQPVEDALKKQVAQEQLLNQVITQTRKSLDLNVIMATAVDQVREFLGLDRLVIYKFEGSTPNLAPKSTINNNKSNSLQIYSSLESSLNGWQQNHGCIVYEVRADENISSVMDCQEEQCFASQSPCWEKYRHGFILSVDDVETTYAQEECLLEFFREIHVRAILAAPIIFEEKLWGLLVAHQCNKKHKWADNEVQLLSAIAEQLAIAIHQTELMRSLNLEKQSLERRVVERTEALHDALVAAQAAGRLRNEFLATISHELLTPLTYVIGMSSTLLRWHFGELNQRQRDYLQTIHDSGEHLLEMIHDILDLSQIEAGKAVLNVTEFSLAQVAEAAVESLLEKATSQEVSLCLDLLIEPQNHCFCADARRVQQIIWNLLSNGIKFTPKSGNVNLRIWRENDNIVLQVEDTGIGIPEDKLPLLFEQFNQLDTPYNRLYEGTGLGLALTKQLVELHRGRIEVESTVGAGSIFTVWIPLQPISDKVDSC